MLDVIGRNLIVSNKELKKKRKICAKSFFFFLRNNYNILLTPQFKPFPPLDPKHSLHGKMPIQLQGFWLCQELYGI